MERMKPQGDDKPHGIKEIADALGVSIGTVDRALHDRKGVNAKTRDKVLKMAQKLNYTPNIAARSLKLNRQLKLGVYLPKQIASYFDTLRDGIRAAANAETAINIDLHFHSYPRLGKGDIEIMQLTDWLHFDGLIMSPGLPSRMTEISNAAAQHGKPIVCVSTDAPRMHRLASITADSFVSGGIAAELLGSWIADRGEVAVFTGDLQVQDHADKLRGFAAMLATNATHLTLLPAIESHESFDHAYKATKTILAKHPHLRGLYVNTANCLPVLRAVAELGRFSQIRTVTTDLFPEMIPYLENGQVNASLYQRPFTQGKLAVETLTAFLARGMQPQMNTRLAPHIVLRSNLPLFTERLDRPRSGNSEF